MFDKLERLAVVTAYSESCVSHDRLMEISKDHTADISAALHALVKKKCLDQSGKGRGTIYFPIGRSPERGEVTAGEPPLPNIATSNVATSNVAGSNVAGFDEKVRAELGTIAAPARSKRKMPHTDMVKLILRLCRVEYLSVEEIAELLDRDAKSLRNNFINEMVKNNFLKPKYRIKNHPDQRYHSWF